MRTTATCPKCSGKKLVVAELRDVKTTDGANVQIHTLPALAVQEQKWRLPKHERVATLGAFESWICATCGYTELYAKDLGEVDQFAARWPKDVRIVDSAVPAKGPFR